MLEDDSPFGSFNGWFILLPSSIEFIFLTKDNSSESPSIKSYMKIIIDWLLVIIYKL